MIDMRDHMPICITQYSDVHESVEYTQPIIPKLPANQRHKKRVAKEKSPCKIQ